jgi:tetratricopeptide (TPR) repeat protein
MKAFSLFQESSAAVTGPQRGTVLNPSPTLPQKRVRSCSTEPTETELTEANQALTSARQWGISDDAQGRRLIEALLRVSALRLRQREVGRAISLLKEAKNRFAEFTKPDAPTGVALAMALGDCCATQEDLPAALEQYHTALQAAAGLSSPEKRIRLPRIYQTIAECCDELGDYIHAAEYRDLAEGLGQKSAVSSRVAAPGISSTRTAALIDGMVEQKNRAGQSCQWLVVDHRFVEGIASRGRTHAFEEILTA